MENISKIFITALRYELESLPRGTKTQIARHLKISAGRLADYLNGRVNTTEEIRRQICNFLGFKDFLYDSFLQKGRDLLDGKEPSSFSATLPTPRQAQISLPPPLRAVPEGELKSDYHQIPFRGDMRLAAGAGEAPEGFYEVDNSPVVIHKNALRRHSTANLAAFRVGGDSMEPTIMPGGIIVADLSYRDDWNRLKSKAIYMIWLDDAVAVKRLEWAKQGEALAVLSDNPVYGAVYRDVDDLRLFGRVIWSWGEH